MKNSKPKTVGSYIKAAAPEAQGKLRQLRQAISQAAPKAEEKLSYGMPYYHYLGRLAYFAAFKHHIGLYIPSPVVAEYKKELKGYVTAMATIRFPMEKPIPVALVKKLVKARMRNNEAKKKK